MQTFPARRIYAVGFLTRTVRVTAIVSTVRLAVDDGVATKTDAAALGAAIANLEARLTRLVLLTSGATIAALVALLKL
ncbi:MAG: hypothetical protein OXC05_03720 [Halieaceae bacterium]|nr:hypothetical protein [Halieaceae bacterium]